MPPPSERAPTVVDRVKKGARTAVHHVKRHVGVGIICSVAYFDPYVCSSKCIHIADMLVCSGNWSVDLQAGSSFGYRPMLFVILTAGLGAVVLQVREHSPTVSENSLIFSILDFVRQTRLRYRARSASFVDVIHPSECSAVDLASHCRLLLHDHPRHPKLVRRCILYPLYVLAEIAIISTDLAELLGSAIGFCLLFPKLPLWAGVVLTAADVLIFLSFSDPTRSHGRPVRVFEYTIIALVSIFKTRRG